MILIARRIGLVLEKQDAREMEVRERIHGCKAADALAPALKMECLGTAGTVLEPLSLLVLARHLPDLINLGYGPWPGRL